MNFQDMDALGGFIEGGKARMAEDTTRINQENLLAQIAKSQQEQDIARQKLPFELEGLQLGNLDKKSITAQRDVQTEGFRGDEARKASAAYIGDLIRFGDGPGIDDGLAEHHKIPANHPVRKMARAALEASKGWTGAPGEGEVPPIVKLQQALAMQSESARTAAARDEAQFKRESMKQDEMTRRTAETNATRERIAQISANARQAAARLSAQAASTRNFSLQQYAAKLISEADVAAQEGNMEKANQIRQKAEEAMQQAIRLEAAKGTAREEAEAARLAAITGGTINTTGAGRAGAAAAAAGPRVDAANPAAGTSIPNVEMAKEIGPSYDPNKFEYRKNPQTGKWQSRPKTQASAAPAEEGDYSSDVDWFRGGRAH